MQGIYKTSAAMCASSKIFQWMNYLLTAYKYVFVKKFSLFNSSISLSSETNYTKILALYGAIQFLKYIPSH